MAPTPVQGNPPVPFQERPRPTGPETSTRFPVRPNFGLDFKKMLVCSPGVFDFKAYDPSTWSLVAANGFALAQAVYEHWSLPVALLTYWFQSVIIGVFNVARLAMFSGFTSSDKIKDKKTARLAAYFLAFFFALHYGGFHWGYWSFLRGWARHVDMAAVLVPSAVFFANHLFSYLYNYKKESGSQRPEDVGRLMFFPYFRIVPMHMTIIAGMFIFLVTSLMKLDFAETVVLVLFLVFKTGADVKMHLVEHAWAATEENGASAAKQSQTPAETD